MYICLLGLIVFKTLHATPMRNETIPFDIFDKYTDSVSRQENTQNFSDIISFDTSSFLKLNSKVCGMLLKKPEMMNFTLDVIRGTFIASMLKFFGVANQIEHHAVLHANTKRFRRKVLHAIIDYIVYNRYTSSSWIIDGYLGITPQLVQGSRMSAYNYSMSTLFSGVVGKNVIDSVFLRYAPQVLIICVQMEIREHLLQQLANSEYGAPILIVGDSWESPVYPRNDKWTTNSVTLLVTSTADVTLYINLTQFSNWETLEEKCTVMNAANLDTKQGNYSTSQDRYLDLSLQDLTKDDVNFELFDIFQSPECVVKNKIAVWNPSRGLHFLEDAQTALLETNLRLRTVKSFSYDEMPYSYPNDTNAAYLNDIYLAVASRLNASLIIKDLRIEISRNYWSMIVNGEKIGPVGYLYNRVADLLIFKLYYSMQRKKLIRFLPPLVRVGMKIIIKEPPENALNAMYILPLRPIVWIILSLLLLTTVCLLGIGHKLDKSYTRGPKSCTPTRDMFVEALFEEPSGIASRTFLVTFLWTSFLSSCYYTSAFTSYLTIANIILPFENIEGLADNMDYAITYPRDMFYQEMFINTPNQSAFLKIRDRIGSPMSPDLPLSMQDAIINAETGKYALLSDAAVAEHYLQNVEHKFIFLPGQYIQKFDYSGARADFPFTRIITTTLLRMKEIGVTNRFQMKHLHNPNNAKLWTANAKPTAQSLESVVPLYLALAAGISMAISSLAIEIFLNFC